MDNALACARAIILPYARLLGAYDDNILKPYLYDVRTTGGHRTNLDNDKAASYPDIYVHFQNDTDYSFFFTADPSKEVTLDTLLQKIEHRNHS